MIILNETKGIYYECYYKLLRNVLLKPVTAAVDADCRSCKKDCKNKKDTHSDVLFYHVALPMLESLEEKPEFEEAGDTAVREAVYTKARRCWCHYTMIRVLSVTMCHRPMYIIEKDDYIYNTVKKRINIL